MNKHITTIILTKNEEKNIGFAIESARQISSRIIIIDCGSEDDTVSIAESMGADVYFHDWFGHAKQFNWALDNCAISTPWVFRLDADERISRELATEIVQKIESTNVDGFEMRWRIYFMDKWIRHGGTHKPYFLRLFRYGKGRVEEKIMDEHIIVDGVVEKLDGDLIHYDYKGLNSLLSKHIWYSDLELEMYENQMDMSGGKTDQKAKRTFYYKLPLFLRARLYFWYRYYLQLGFLDGKEGKIYAFLQSYWYRYLVDAKIYEKSIKSGNKLPTLNR